MAHYTAAEMIAKHWVDDGEIDPLACLLEVLRAPPIVTSNGFTRLVGTPLDVPSSWGPKLHLPTVAVALAVLCRPVAAGVALLMASRASTQVGIEAWGLMRHHCTMPAAVSAAFASRRTDIQHFVASTWRAITIAAGPSCWLWIADALDGSWVVPPGSRFASDLRGAMATMEIETMRCKGGNLTVWDDVGVEVLIGDRCLLLLYLLFGAPQYVSSTPPYVASQIKSAACAPWINTIRLCHPGLQPS